MNEIVKSKVRRIVAAVLRVPAAELDDGAALCKTERWDSLAQLDILASMEQEFGMAIEPDEALDLTTLAALIAHVETHA